MDFERAGKMPWDAITTSQFEQFMMYRLLLDHPNNYVELLGRRERSLTPRDLRRRDRLYACQSRRANYCCGYLGCIRRCWANLIPIFSRLPGHFPHALLARCPLRKVRQALRLAKAEEGVAHIAGNGGSPTWAVSRSNTASVLARALRKPRGSTGTHVLTRCSALECSMVH